MLAKAKRGLAILLALVLVLCLAPAAVFADGEETGYTDGTYKVTDITSSFRMFKSIIVADSSQVIIKEGKAYLVIVTNSDARYAEIMLGKYAEKIVTGQEEGIKGFTNDIANDDGTKGLTYVIPLEDSEAFLSFPEGGSVLYVILRYKKGYSDEHDGDWYQPSSDVTVTVSGIEKISDDTTIPTGQSTEPEEPEEPEEPTVTKIEYTGSDLGFFKEDLTSAFGMLTPQDGSYTAVDGDKVVIHIVPKNKTVYNGIHWGAITDELTKDVSFNADGTIDMELAAADYCGWASPVAPIKVKDGKTTADQYYLAIPAADKLPAMAEVQADLEKAAPAEETIAAIGEVTLDSEEKITAAREAYDSLTAAQKKLVSNYADLEAAEKALADLKAAAEAAHMDLTITNNVGMFKVVTAFVETAEDGSKTLVIALNGKGYENLFKGTYEEAKANGNDRTKWITSELNADGKLEFRIPIAEDESYIPVVAISKSYVEKFDAGQNPIERAFFPRQMELDLDAKTLVVSEYENTVDLTIENNVKMFKVDSASLTNVGGPNSNNYAAILNFLYGSDAFDKAFIGKASEADSAEIITPENRLYQFKLRWIVTAGDPDSVVDLMKDSITVSFHSVKNDSWYERVFTVSESKGKLTITEAAAEDDVVKVVSSKDKDSENAPAVLKDLEEDKKLTKKTAVEVNDKVDNEESIDIVWQKDITVPADAVFPVTIEFEYEDKDANFFVYHFNGEKWEVAGEGAGGKATVTFEKLSPVAVVAVNTPNTGDHSDAFLWGAILLVCAAAAVVLIVSRRKEEK